MALSGRLATLPLRSCPASDDRVLADASMAGKAPLNVSLLQRRRRNPANRQPGNPGHVSYALSCTNPLRGGGGGAWSDVERYS